MPLDAAVLFLSLMLGPVAPLTQAPALAANALSAPASFLPAERAVANWRVEALRRLATTPASIAAATGGQEAREPPRCVKLNNYWCIKGAGWNGMVAADSEGHAAFSSAVEGAAVAALLLRRYYLEFSRRTANDIVSRWAPPQCGAPVARVAGAGIAQRRPTLGPDPAGYRAPLTTRGLGNTLRAHFLAVRRAGGRGGARVAARRSVVPDRVGSLIKAPTISAGFKEMSVALPPIRLASLVSPMAMPGPSAPMFSCALDGQRLRNYALRAIEGIAASPDHDLKLFETDGTPLPALARLMENMSSVEIGPLRPDPTLVRAGIDSATAALRAAREPAPALRGAMPEEAAR